MAKYNHLPIYKTTYELLLDLMNLVGKFPRDYKYTIGEKIQKHVINIFILIYKSNSSRHKTNYINEILTEIQYLDLFLRMSHDLKIVSQERYCSYVEKAGSIAKQAQGWLKSYMPKEPEPVHVKA